MLLQEEIGKYNAVLEEAYSEAQKVTCIRNRDWLDSPWDAFFMKRDPLKSSTTGIAKEQIDLILDKFSSIPKGLNCFSVCVEYDLFSVGSMICLFAVLLHPTSSASTNRAVCLDDRNLSLKSVLEIFLWYIPKGISSLASSLCSCLHRIFTTYCYVHCVDDCESILDCY